MLCLEFEADEQKLPDRLHMTELHAFTVHSWPFSGLYNPWKKGVFAQCPGPRHFCQYHGVGKERGGKWERPHSLFSLEAGARDQGGCMLVVCRGLAERGPEDTNMGVKEESG